MGVNFFFAKFDTKGGGGGPRASCLWTQKIPILIFEYFPNRNCSTNCHHKIKSCIVLFKTKSLCTKGFTVLFRSAFQNSELSFLILPSPGNLSLFPFLLLGSGSFRLKGKQMMRRVLGGKWVIWAHSRLLRKHLGNL